MSFDRAAGWDQPRAEAWAREHLGRHDRGRTARLDVPHRMTPDLAAFAAEVLALDGYRLSAPAAPPAVAVEFLPVPPLPDGDGLAGSGRNGSHPRLDPNLRGGAGLELDLADPRQRERLPESVRGRLSAHGLVNPDEAAAVVSPDMQDLLAGGYVRAIEDFLRTAPH